MKLKFTETVYALFITLIILVFFDIFSTTLVPALGLSKLKLNFNVLIILYLSFYIETPYLSIFILVIQYFHSMFTIEGWAYGTLTAVLMSILVGHLKDLLHFNTTWITVVVTLVFQYLWFIIMCGLMYIRLGNVYPFVERIWIFIPESFILAICSPFFFSLMNRFWKNAGRDGHGDQVDV